ncbi:MAG: TonB-dependent receptor plug domain-containing protein [Myxococcota bacterium]
MLGTALLVLGLVAGQADPGTASSTVAVEPTGTATLAGALFDPEELALLQQIEAETATAALEPIPLSAALDEAHPRTPALNRSLGTLLSGAPLVIDSRRRFRPNDEVVLRGRAGARLEITLDGQSLENALTRSDQRDDLGLVPASSVEAVEVDRAGAAIALGTRTPTVSLHLGTDVAAVVRSADRSTGADLYAEAGSGFASVSARASYQDFEELRLGGRIGRDVGSSERLSLGAKAQILGRSEDPVRALLGASFDRLTNVLRYDLSPLRFGLPSTAVLVDRQASRKAVFGGLRLGSNIELNAGFDAYQRDHTTATGSKDIVGSDQADTLQAGLGAQVSPTEGLRLGLNAKLLSSRGSIVAASQLHDGEIQRLWVGGNVGLDLAPLRLDLDGGLRYLRTRLDGAEVTAVAPRIRASAAVELTPGFSLDLSADLDGRLPSFGDWILSHADGLSPVLETSVGGALGFELRATWIAASLHGFVRRSQNPFEPRAGSFVILPSALLSGGEARLLWSPTARLSLDLLASFTRALDVPLAGVPGLLVQGNLRYDFPLRGAYAEIYLRGHAGARETPEDVGSLASLSAEWSYAVVGARVGAELGAGFSAAVVIDNAFDLPNRALASRIGGPGIDVLASLRHRFELE